MECRADTCEGETAEGLEGNAWEGSFSQVSGSSQAPGPPLKESCVSREQACISTPAILCHWMGTARGESQQQPGLSVHHATRIVKLERHIFMAAILEHH